MTPGQLLQGLPQPDILLLIIDAKGVASLGKESAFCQGSKLFGKYPVFKEHNLIG